MTIALAGILLLTPIPAKADSVHWRFTQKLGSCSVRHIRQGMKDGGAVEDQCGFVTVRRCGTKTETPFLLYPSIKACVYEIVDASGEPKLIGGDIAINRKVRFKELSSVVEKCVHILKGE